MSNIVVVNFGGPRTLEEIEPFLKALLCDKDVIRSKLPLPLHRFFFSYVAKKRARKIRPDYQKIGGGSPIFEDTERVARLVGDRLGQQILTFHRYLPMTHPQFFASIEKVYKGEIRIFPMFPQFSYATTGSIARFFSSHLPREVVQNMRWVKSYPTHPAYIQSMENTLREFLSCHHLSEEETVLLFSAHGLPREFIETGDIYESECHRSFEAIRKRFPHALARLSFQSMFGRSEWIRPYTVDVCHQILSWHEGRKNIVFVPLSFTSDHIETLFEIEDQYLPLIREKGLRALRVPALNCRSDWIEAITTILQEADLVSNQMLIKI